MPISKDFLLDGWMNSRHFRRNRKYKYISRNRGTSCWCYPTVIRIRVTKKKTVKKLQRLQLHSSDIHYRDSDRLLISPGTLDLQNDHRSAISQNCWLFICILLLVSNDEIYIYHCQRNTKYSEPGPPVDWVLLSLFCLMLSYLFNFIFLQ